MDIVNKFISKYTSNNISGALNEILPSQRICYDEILSDNEELCDRIIDYVESIVFRDTKSIYLTNKLLQKSMLKNGYDSHIINIQKHFMFFLNCMKFKEEKNNLIGIFNINHIPYYPISYPQETNIHINSTDIPILFMESYSINWKLLLMPLKQKKAIFVFYNQKILLHCLQFDAVLESLLEDKHVIYVHGIYPQILFNKQISKKEEWKHFEPILIDKKSILTDKAEFITDLIAKCIENLSYRQIKYADDLYQLGEKIKFSIDANRLGTKRFAAMYTHYLMKKWHDSQKATTPKYNELRTSKYMDKVLKTLIPISPRRNVNNRINVNNKKKLNIAHIIGRISSQMAVSKRLISLLEGYNKNDFNVYLFTSEFQAISGQEPIFHSVETQTSRDISSKTLDYLQKIGIKVHCFFEKTANYKYKYFEMAKCISTFMSQQKIDIVIFHDVNVINFFIGKITDAPVRILMEHGHFPCCKGCFDAIIVSHEEEISYRKKLSQYLGIPLIANPNAFDVKATWGKRILTKADLNLPEEAVLMTTSSHCLHGRLSYDMCTAISQILKRCHNAYYLPIGPQTYCEKQIKTFEQENVDDKVIFLERVDNPAQLMRTMDIYLNEFPHGSGLSILEAMAAGCPIVTMFYKNGPIQGRHGGYYYGIDKAITSCKQEDYVNLACRLINDKKFYKKWSNHALKKYISRSNVEEYIWKHENILKTFSKRVQI